MIGEAIGKLHGVDSALASTITDYRKMIAFRNVLIHGYTTVDPVIVWGVIERNLNLLVDEVKLILDA